LFYFVEGQTVRLLKSGSEIIIGCCAFKDPFHATDIIGTAEEQAHFYLFLCGPSIRQYSLHHNCLLGGDDAPHRRR
jgi:hypothetical protein